MAGQDAWGTSFRRETDTPGTFESIANCTDISGPSREREAIEVERVAEHERIVAVKDAKGDLYEGSWVMARCDLAFYSGDDALNLGWFTHGAVGAAAQ